MNKPTDQELSAVVDHISEDNEGLFYNKETGRLYRIQEMTTTRDKGDRIAPRSITFQGKQNQATRIIFYLVMGRWPAEGMVIDHRDCDVNNNRWNNLREATYAQNMYNKTPPGRWVNADEGFVRGVSKIGNRYRVLLNGILFGSFATKEEANVVANEQRRLLHGEFTHGDLNEAH